MFPSVYHHLSSVFLVDLHIILFCVQYIDVILKVIIIFTPFCKRLLLYSVAAKFHRRCKYSLFLLYTGCSGNFIIFKSRKNKTTEAQDISALIIANDRV